MALFKVKAFNQKFAEFSCLLKDNNWFWRLKKNKQKTLNYINKNVPTKKFCDPNSIFNLISIIKYKYGSKVINERYLPFHVKLLDFNLFYNVTLRK